MRTLGDLDFATGYRRFWWVIPPLVIVVMVLLAIEVFEGEPRDGWTLSDTVTQNFVTGEAPRIHVENAAGAIAVRAGRDGAVFVRVVRQGRGHDEAAAFAALVDSELRITRDGDRIMVVATGAEGEGTALARIEIVVPERAVLELEQRAGPITVDAVRGDITAHAGDGDIALTLRAGRGFRVNGSGGFSSEFSLRVESQERDAPFVTSEPVTQELRLYAEHGRVILQRK